MPVTALWCERQRRIVRENYQRAEELRTRAERAEQDARSAGDPAGGVGGEVVEAEVSLGFHNPAGCRAVDEDLPEEVARDLGSRALIERSGKDRTVRRGPHR